MATLTDAINVIQATVLAFSDIKEAPSTPPESLNQFPFAVSYARTVGWARLSDWKRGKHTIYTEFHVARQMLQKDIARAMPFNELFANAILGDPTLSGTVDTVLEIRGTFGKMEWGGQDTIGWQFETDVKMQSAIT